MSLLDILGNYYDSAANTVTEVPGYCEFTIKFTVTGFSGSSLQFKSIVNDGQKYADLPPYQRDMLELCNFFVPNFCVNNKIRDHNRERFNIITEFRDGKTYEANGVTNFNHLEPVAKWLEGRESIPKKYEVKYRVKRETNQDVRYKASLAATGGKHPKDYFAAVLDASFDSSRTPHSKRAVQNAFKSGTIKSMILNHYRKEEAVFLAEYLYGVKVPKNATYAEFFTRLANKPQTDFGIKDVQVLKRMMQIIRSDIHPANTTKALLDIGVKPATSLKRWYKKNEGLEDLVKTS